MGIEVVTACLRSAAARLADLDGRQRSRPAARNSAGRPPAGRFRQPSHLRSFDPRRVADLEYRAWVGYYLRNWPQVLAALVGLVRTAFGMNWYRTLQGAWLLLRASQLWAPIPDNDPDGAQACMRRFYALIRLSYGEPASPARAAALEVDWWRVHRHARYPSAPRGSGDELVESVTALYCYLYSEPEAGIRPAAMHRVLAMDLSDRWVAEGCLPGSPLLAQEHGALVQCYTALLAAVQRGV
jgi:hypothetical protein